MLKKGSYLSNFLQQTLRTNQVEINTDSRTNKAVAKLKEPRDLYALQKEFCPQQAPRWPAECQVVEDHIRHIDYAPSFPEQYYEVTGSEVQPKPVGEEYGEVIFQYFPVSAVNYFSRSCVGGNQVVINGIPLLKNNDQFLRFESRFESGNLAKAVRVTDTYYELYLRTDMYTNRHMQWYYFRVENMKKHLWYRFSIVNLTKPDSLYSCGMKPLMYSTREAAEKSIGWRRCGDNITYFRNDSLSDDDDDQPTSYTLSFNVAFPHDDDTVYMAHSYPYTYTHLQDYLMQLHNDPLKSTFCKLRLLCRSLAGNNVYYLTITAPSTSEEPKKKKAIVVTARVHPGETPSSWMMKGFIDYLTSDSYQARELREKFIFKLVPMLNPDGVIVGNNRCSLTGRDLNRQYRTVMRETYPPVWHTKVMIRRLMEECGILMYCDLHAHSRKHNIFMYGCETKITSDRHLQEQVFPLMLHKNAADKFSFESCKFKIQKSKEGTGRIVVWMMGILNSYTMEASFGGSLLGSRSNTHFSTADFESMGKYFCETLIDFCDEDPAKERLRTKIINRLAKEGSSAEEPTNIDLSDYTSDEGDTSSCTDDEDNVQQIMNNFGQQLDSNITLEESQSTRLSKKNLRENRKTMKNMGFPEKNPRRPLKVNQATLKLTPGAAESSEMPSCDISDDRTLEDIAALLSRKQKLDWVKRAQGRKDNLTSAAKGGKGGERTFMTAMPPELVVTSAQVYDNQTFFESSGRYTRKETRDDMPQISRSAVGFRRYDDKPEFRRHRSHSVSVETAEENQTGYRIHPCCSKYSVSSRPGFYREKVPHQAVDDLSYDLQWKMNIHSASILNPMRQRLWFRVQAPVEPEGTSAQYVENHKIMEQNNAPTKRNITEQNKDVVIWGYTNKPICLENQHAAVDRGTSGSKKIKNTVHSVTKGTGKAETSDSVKHKRKQRLKKQKALKTEKEIQIIEECIKSSSHDANKKSISSRSGIVHTLKKQHASCSAERSEEEKKIKSPKKCTEKFHSQSTSRSPCRKKPQVSSITDTDSDDGNKSEDLTSTHRKNRKRKITQKKPKKIAATLSQAKKPLKKNIKKKTGT